MTQIFKVRYAPTHLPAQRFRPGAIEKEGKFVSNKTRQLFRHGSDIVDGFSLFTLFHSQVNTRVLYYTLLYNAVTRAKSSMLVALLPAMLYLVT